MTHLLALLTPWDPLHNDGYQWWSGLGSGSPILLGIALWWRKHNCHQHRCWRLQWHPHPDHGHPVCKKHHPHEPPGSSRKDAPHMIPINRIVSLLAGPIAALAGGLAAWLVTLHIGLSFGSDEIAKAITAAVVFALTAGVHYAAAHHWLSGWQAFEQQAAAGQHVTPPAARSRTHAR